MRAGADTVVAFIIFAVASIASFALYNIMLNSGGGARQIFHGSISGQETYFKIEQNSQCVGFLKVSSFDSNLMPSSDKNVFQLVILGTLRLALNDRIAEIKLIGGNYLNPLGQLAKARYKLQESDNYLSLSSDGVLQINMTLNWMLNSIHTGNFKSVVPGPVIFIRDSDSTFTLKIPWVLPQQYLNIPETLFSLFGLTIKETSHAETECEAGHAAQLTHLEANVSKIKQTYPEIETLLKGPSDG